MAVRPDRVGTSGPPTRRTWTSTDTLLYALAVGAGQSDPREELAYTTENSASTEQAVVPSFAALLAQGSGFDLVGGFDPASVLHAQQSVRIHRPLTPAGSAEVVPTVAGIYDKGSAALAVVESAVSDPAAGQPIATCRSSLFIRGAGGFGGERGPAQEWHPPEHAPDFSAAMQVPVHQALLYRLTGDRNPLHSDPEFAARAGFDRPILHGMCTYGYTARALVRHACGADPSRFAAMDARFTAPVYPGDTLTVQGWCNGPEVRFRTLTGTGIAIDRGTLLRRTE